MPQSVKDKDKFLASLLKGDPKHGCFGLSPIENFGIKLQNQTFTRPFQQYIMFKKQLQLLEEEERIIKLIKEAEQTSKRDRMENFYELNPLFFSLLPPRSFRKDSDLSSLSSDSSEMSEEEK